MAAEQGYADAPFTLGIMYFMGKEIPNDDVEAFAWLSVASAKYNEMAIEVKKIITKRMTHDQIAMAKNLSLEYLEAYGSTRQSK